MTKITIDGRKIRFADWKAKVIVEADRVDLSDAARELVTGAMLRDGFEKNETAEYFVSTVANMV